MLKMGRVEVQSGGAEWRYKYIYVEYYQVFTCVCRVPVFIDNADQELTGIYLNNKSIPEHIKHREG